MTIILLSYVAIGTVLYAGWDTWSPERKVVYGFLFPLHLALIWYGIAVWKGGPFLHNKPIWILVFVIWLLLFLATSH